MSHFVFFFPATAQMWVSPPVFTPEDRSWVAGGLRARGLSEPGLPGDSTWGLPPLQPLLRGGEKGHVGKREQFIRESQLFVASLQLMSLFLHVGLQELLAWSLWYLLRQRSPEFSFSAALDAGHSECPAWSLSAFWFPTEAVVFWSEIFYTVYFVPNISRS